MITDCKKLNKTGSHESNPDINQQMNNRNYNKEGDIYIVSKYLLTEYLYRNKT